MRKKHTLDEYKALGALFKKCNKSLNNLATKIRGADYCKRFIKAITTINQLRSAIEEDFYKDFPDDFSTMIFYGPEEEL